MADIRINDKVLSDAVRGWLELEGLADAGCVIADEENAVGCSGPLVVISQKQNADGCALTLPLSFAELTEAVRRAAAERVTGDESPELAAEEKLPVISPDGRTVSYRGREAVLSPREADLFGYLYANANTVVPREKLCENVWHGAVTGETNSVDVYISYLRRRIEPLFGKGAIVSVRGEGYMLVL